MEHIATSLGGYRGLRGELLVALKKAQQLTVHELAVRFGVTPNALRRHLKELEAAGLVRFRREVHGVGGPVFAYSLTDQGEALFPRAYGAALTQVLDLVREQLGEHGVAMLFERQWAALAAEAKPTLVALPLRERAQFLAELLSAQGYMAEAETPTPTDATIREHNCAIRAVAERFPEACAAEAKFLEDVLGAPVERRLHIASGCSRCEYHVHATTAADGHD